jgi:hypothetical protein
MKRRGATKTGKMRGAGGKFSLFKSRARVAPAPAALRRAAVEHGNDDIPPVDPNAFAAAAAEDAAADQKTEYINDRIEEFQTLNSKLHMLITIMSLDLNNPEDKTTLFKFHTYYHTGSRLKRVSNTNARTSQYNHNYYNLYNKPHSRKLSSQNLQNDLFRNILVDTTVQCWMLINPFLNANAMLNGTTPEIYETRYRLLDNLRSALGSCIGYLETIMQLPNFSSRYDGILNEARTKTLFNMVFSEYPFKELERNNMDLRRLLTILGTRHKTLDTSLTEAMAERRPLEEQVAELFD